MSLLSIIYTVSSSTFVEDTKKLRGTLSIGVNLDLDFDLVLPLTSVNSLSEHDEILLTSWSLLSNVFSICVESSHEIFNTSTVGEKTTPFFFGIYSGLV